MENLIPSKGGCPQLLTLPTETLSCKLVLANLYLLLFTLGYYNFNLFHVLWRMEMTVLYSSHRISLQQAR